MPVDFRWSSQGGIMLDGTGDICLTSDPIESYADMVRSRLKAAINAWKLYPGIGAGLKQSLGYANSNETEIALRKRVLSSLTTNFLPSGTFDVNTLALDDEITVMVYLNQSLIAQATVSTNSDAVTVS
jgi:hypothetical protein